MNGHGMEDFFTKAIKNRRTLFLDFDDYMNFALQAYPLKRKITAV